MVLRAVLSRPSTLTDTMNHYCGGCGHGIDHRLVAEALDHFNLRDSAVGVAPAGCSVMLNKYFDVDTIESVHGRALAVATGIKRANPNRFVFTYKGDSNLTNIGMCETIHAANRRGKISVIFINNAFCGMIGGQMAPTTLIGQQTTTTPHGRKIETEGTPIKMAELMAGFSGVTYCECVALFNPKEVIRTRKAIFRSFEAQLSNAGMGFVEIFSPCVTKLKLNARKAKKWVEKEMCAAFSLGLIKNTFSKEYSASNMSRGDKPNAT